MLRSIKQLYGDALVASDANIGHVKDFYFDDHRWVVRYVVVDTGAWLTGRLVLISPHAFGNFHSYGDFLLVNLTKSQIQGSPAVDSHKPVSRQYEEEYYNYYGFPPYWQGDGLWGSSDYPVAPLPIEEEKRAHGQRISRGDPHLRSAQALKGYHIQTEEGTIGHVSDLLIDGESLAIRYLVVETGHWLWGKEIVITPKNIDSISYEESKVFVKVTKQAIQEAAKYSAPRAEYNDARNFDD